MTQMVFNFYLTARVKVVVESKLCPVCQQDKPATEFYRMAASKDNLAGRCKTCQAQYAKERHQRLYQDPAYRKAQSAKVIQCRKAKKLEYLAKNPVQPI